MTEQGQFYECDDCGARLTFKPGSAKLRCEYCGHEQAIADTETSEASAPDEIVEYDFQEALRNARRRPAAELMEGGREVNCKGCGATTVLSTQAGNCPYCDSPVVASTASERDKGIIVPESVLPFKLTAIQARVKFLDWIKSLWFAPNDLTKRSRGEAIDGVYLPYWTYDSHTTTNYTGQRGVYYYVSQSYTDSQGNRRTRQVRRTRWNRTSGVVRASFDDVLVCGSKSLPQKMINELEPWDLQHLVPYDPAYLSGFIAERYKIGLRAGFRIAEQRMKPKIEQRIRRDIGGDDQRISSMSIRHANVTFKHTLLPLYISSFRYSEKVYRFIINARTGEVAGERPWSWIKITLAVLAVLLVIGIIVALMQQSGGSPH